MLGNNSKNLLKGFQQDLQKAHVEGVYADTPQNRKFGRVGMTYKQYEDIVKNHNKTPLISNKEKVNFGWNQGIKDVFALNKERDKEIPTEKEREDFFNSTNKLTIQSNYLFQKPLNEWDEYDLSNWKNLKIKVEKDTKLKVSDVLKYGQVQKYNIPNISDTYIDKDNIEWIIEANQNPNHIWLASKGRGGMGIPLNVLISDYKKKEQPQEILPPQEGTSGFSLKKNQEMVDYYENMIKTQGDDNGYFYGQAQKYKDLIKEHYKSIETPKAPFFIEATEDTIDDKIREYGILGMNKFNPPTIGLDKNGRMYEMFMHSEKGKKGWMIHDTSKKVKPEFIDKYYI